MMSDPFWATGWAGAGPFVRGFSVRASSEEACNDSLLVKIDFPGEEKPSSGSSHTPCCSGTQVKFQNQSLGRITDMYAIIHEIQINMHDLKMTLCSFL